MEIDSQALTTCEVTNDGGAISLGFVDTTGNPATIRLSLDQVGALAMTLPGLIDKALQTRFGDQSLRNEYRLASWVLEQSTNPTKNMITLRTVDGFSVCFSTSASSRLQSARGAPRAEDDAPCKLGPLSEPSNSFCLRQKVTRELTESFDMSHPRLQVRRGARARAAMTMRSMLVSAVSLLVMTGVSSAADPDIISGMHDGDLAAIISELPPDHPMGAKATVALVSLKRALHLDEPFLSTFIVDFLPGGSAVLHRSPTAGYVLVHVLSGTIRAQAWDAGMGTYRCGQTWVEPAFANDITAKNASAVEPARALVFLITKETSSWESPR